MKEKQEFYVVKSKGLAVTLQYVFGFDYYAYEHHSEPGKKVYSFIKTKEFNDALTLIMSLRNKK